MWYTGYDRSRFRTGLATSADGITRTRIPGPGYGSSVLDTGDATRFDYSGAYSPAGSSGRIEELGLAYFPSIIRIGNTLKMWYMQNDGSTNTVNYAEKIAY